MATPNRKNTDAPAEQAAASAPAAGLNLAALAAGAVAIKEMPKTQRQEGGTAALAALVEQSYSDRKAFELPAVPVPADKMAGQVAATLVAAVRRAATMVNLGVNIRWRETPDGVVVAFQGKNKRKG